MKKNFFRLLFMIIWLALLYVSVTACSSQAVTKNVLITTTVSVDINPGESEESLHGIESSIYYIYDIKEYRTYIATAGYPDDFVDYDSNASLVNL